MIPDSDILNVAEVAALLRSSKAQVCKGIQGPRERSHALTGTMGRGNRSAWKLGSRRTTACHSVVRWTRRLTDRCWDLDRRSARSRFRQVHAQSRNPYWQPQHRYVPVESVRRCISASRRLPGAGVRGDCAHQPQNQKSRTRSWEPSWAPLLETEQSPTEIATVRKFDSRRSSGRSPSQGPN